jgi:pimeloyl-ACP methyl ester carboxylesterase
MVGHSLGADIAGRLAAAEPVRGVVLVDPALRNFAAAMPAQTDALPSWMQPIITTMQALRTQTHRERMVTGVRLLPPRTPMWHEADYVAFVDGHARFDVATYRSIANIGYLVEAPDVIGQIKCPVLLLTARPMLLGVTIDAGVQVFEQHWHDGQHIHFPNSGHFIPFDQFPRFMEVLTNFLQQY